MISPELAHLLASTRVDVWDLFQRDAQGRTGFYRGQLVAELEEARPDLVPDIVTALKLGFESDDERERVAALAGAMHLRARTDFGEAIEALLERDPSLSSSPVLLRLVSRQASSPALERVVDRIAALPVPDGATVEHMQVLVMHRPASVVAQLEAALEAPSRPEDDARWSGALRGMSPLQVERIVDDTWGKPRATRERLAGLLYVSLAADEQPASYDRWMMLRARLGLAPEGLPPRPYESEADRERMRAFLARLATTAEKCPTPNATTTVVLGTGVWLDALRFPEGPPVELQDLLRQRCVAVLRSRAMLEAIGDGLRQLGWDEGRREEAIARVSEMTRDYQAAGARADGRWEIPLAKAAGLDVVFAVGADSGRVVDGVAFEPVRVLIERLRAAA